MLRPPGGERLWQNTTLWLIKWHHKRGGSWSERRYRWSPAAIWAAVKTMLREGEATSNEQAFRELQDRFPCAMTNTRQEQVLSGAQGRPLSGRAH